MSYILCCDECFWSGWADYNIVISEQLLCSSAWPPLYSTSCVLCMLPAQHFPLLSQGEEMRGGEGRSVVAVVIMLDVAC